MLCDGAGSAPKGGEGASIVAQTIFQRARRHFEAGQPSPDDKTLRTWIDDARELIEVAALNS